MLTDAQFGNMFKTRDGRLAVYAGKSDSPHPCRNFVLIDGLVYLLMFYDDGSKCYDRETPMDLVEKLEPGKKKPKLVQLEIPF